MTSLTETDPGWDSHLLLARTFWKPFLVTDTCIIPLYLAFSPHQLDGFKAQSAIWFCIRFLEYTTNWAA